MRGGIKVPSPRVLILPVSPAGLSAVEVLVDELDGDRALADRGGHPLDRPVADVADREHPGHAGLERHRRAVQGPPGRRRAVLEQVGAGDDEPPPVAPDGRSLRVRLASRPSPCPSTTSTPKRTVMLRAAWISWTR